MGRPSNRRYHRVYIGVGSNLGDRKANIRKAIMLLKRMPHIRFGRVSSIYETDPVGGPPQNDFLNGVIEIETSLDPYKLLEVLKGIEKSLGRKKTVRNGPRTVDLDILLYGKIRINSKALTIPHPRMHKREFVLKGLRELTNLYKDIF